jgi:hypothetical protein
MNVAFRVTMPHSLQELRDAIKPNLPWADDHFEERVSRVPSNPGEQYKNWPWWRGLGQEKKAMTEVRTPTIGITKEGEVESFAYDYLFTHTYQERFWPREGGDGEYKPRGIRYEYGDLDDVVSLLVRSPHSRQAYLPIFFPEDTGAVHGGRIPCTLGYHFLLRSDRFHLWYDIRSCDAVRHFRDDVYLAARLAFWVLDELKQRSAIGKPPASPTWDKVRPGVFTFHTHSFHVHKGDLHHLSAKS